MSSEDSDNSNLESLRGTPYSSPSQQVPDSNDAVQMNYNNNNTSQSVPCDSEPYLSILIQPQSQYRFRYKSERASGTHGCLNGVCKTPNLNRTYPTVELKNYNKKAIIKCQLYQDNKNEEHPHKLHDEDHGDKEPSAQVPDEDSYTVCFRGLGIIHTAKKHVADWLYKKLESRMTKEELKKKTKKNLRSECLLNANAINLNIVRLRFSAHDVITDKEICKPAFSEPILNMKSPDTNQLKICYSSLCSGRPTGGDDVVFLVEKVKKGNIRINFFEEDSGKKIWEAPVFLKDSDVFHQYAIVFRTPAYKDVEISEDKNVLMELQRQSDGARSNAMPFKYVAEMRYKYKKRPRLDTSSLSSLPQSPASSIPSVSSEMSGRSVNTPQIPIENETPIQRADSSTMTILHTEPPRRTSLPHVTLMADEDSIDLDFLNLISDDTNDQQVAQEGTVTDYYVMPMDESQNATSIDQPYNLINNPMFGEPNVPNSLRVAYQSTPEPSVTENLSAFDSEVNSFLQDFKDDADVYMDPYLKDAILFPDSGRATVSDRAAKNKDKSIEERVYIKRKEGLELKELSMAICKLMSEKPDNWKEDVKTKLERLFEIRMSNGDTFLHMTLSSSVVCLRVLVAALRSVGLSSLLNAANDAQQTVLHLAVMRDIPELATYLVEKGCDPMCADKDRNTVLHHAAKCDRMAPVLLEAMEKNRCKFNIHALNNEWQTPLHVAVLQGAADAVRALVRAGARLADDYRGRTPLHLAVIDDRIHVVRALLDLLPRDVNAFTSRTHMTSLQIACSGPIRTNTLAIIKLLLERGADPFCHEASNDPAWKMAIVHPQKWSIMKEYVEDHWKKSDADANSDDLYESAGEGDSDSSEEGVITQLGAIKLLEVAENT